MSKQNIKDALKSAINRLDEMSVDELRILDNKIQEELAEKYRQACLLKQEQEFGTNQLTVIDRLAARGFESIGPKAKEFITQYPYFGDVLIEAYDKLYNLLKFNHIILSMYEWEWPSNKILITLDVPIEREDFRANYKDKYYDLRSYFDAKLGDQLMWDIWYK